MDLQRLWKSSNWQNHDLESSKQCSHSKQWSHIVLNNKINESIWLHTYEWLLNLEHLHFELVIQFDSTLQFGLRHIDFVLQIWIESHYTNHLDWGHYTCFGLNFVDALSKLFASNYAPNVSWPSMIGDLFSWALLVCHIPCYFSTWYLHFRCGNFPCSF